MGCSLQQGVVMEIEEIVFLQEQLSVVLRDARTWEQFFSNAGDWILRNLGYCNLAIWTPSTVVESLEAYDLRMYVKHVVDGTPLNTRSLLNAVIKRGIKSSQSFIGPLGEESGAYANHHVIATLGTYVGHVNSVIVLTRPKLVLGGNPFSSRDESVLVLFVPLFAVALANRSDSAIAEDDSDEQTDRQVPERKKDPADWWKHGEDPPF